MKILSILNYLFLISVGVAVISTSFRMYKKYRAKYLLYYSLFLILSYAFAFLDIIADYMTLSVLTYNISTYQTIQTVSLIHTLLAFPFIIAAWFFFIYMILEWSGKSFSIKLKTGYFILQAIILITYAYSINQYAISGQIRCSEFSSWIIFIFNAINFGILSLVILEMLFKVRKISDQSKQNAMKIFGIFYLLSFFLHFIVLSLVNKKAFFCYAYPVIVFFMHIPPLLYLRYYLKQYYKNRPVYPVKEIDMVTFFAKKKISEREMEIIRLIIEGKSNHDIEDELYISIKTVKTHLYNIYKKLGIKSRWQLINIVQNYQNNKS